MPMIAEHAREEARVDQVQDRVLDAAAVEIHRQPVASPLPDRTAARRSADRRSGRAYQDESTNVSIVSVSRRAGPPHVGHVTLTNSGTCASGESPRPVNCVTIGSSHGQLVVGHRDDAVLLAVDHRDRRAPVALARDAPVLQPVLDRPLADAALLRERDHSPLRFLRRQVRELARVGGAAVGIGRLGISVGVRRG